MKQRVEPEVQISRLRRGLPQDYADARVEAPRAQQKASPLRRKGNTPELGQELYVLPHALARRPELETLRDLHPVEPAVHGPVPRRTREQRALLIVCPQAVLVAVDLRWDVVQILLGMIRGARRGDS